jgi:hypothetical protein
MYPCEATSGQSRRREKALRAFIAQPPPAVCTPCTMEPANTASADAQSMQPLRVPPREVHHAQHVHPWVLQVAVGDPAAPCCHSCRPVTRSCHQLWNSQQRRRKDIAAHTCATAGSPMVATWASVIITAALPCIPATHSLHTASRATLLVQTWWVGWSLHNPMQQTISHTAVSLHHRCPGQLMPAGMHRHASRQRM